MVIMPIHIDRSRISRLMRLMVFLAIIVPLRWLSLPLIIPLDREDKVAPMQSRNLTGLLHLAQDRARRMVVLLQRVGDLAWIHPICPLLAQQLNDFLAGPGAPDFLGVADD